MSSPPKSEVFTVSIKDIEKNRDNPRMLFDDEDMIALEKSIHLRGIMVPLIVYRKKENEDDFVLLDGERRLRCAKKLDFPSIPVNVIAKPNRTENILRMFNIHKVRKGWELVPTAYSLELLIRLLEHEGKKTSNTELSKLTGMSSWRIGECKRVLKYKKYHYLSLEKNPEKRIGGDFFSQMDLALEKLKKFPEIIDEYSEKKLVEIMIDKKLDGTIDNMLEDFRMLKKILSSEKKGIERKRIVANVKEYLKSKPSKQRDKTGKPSKPAMSMKQVYSYTASSVYTEQEIVSVAENLTKLLKTIEYSEVKKKKEFKNTLIILLNIIEKIIGK